jgi:hypothetical protein
MSLVETYLQRDMFAEAESLLTSLKRVFLSAGDPEYSTHLHLFHVWICLARISHRQSHWDKALSCWTEALASLGRLKMDGNHNAGLVRCSMAHALTMLGHRAEGEAILQRGRMEMASEPRLFWILSFNSQWNDFIMASTGKEMLKA